MDREAWHAAIKGVAKSQTRLSDWTELNWTETPGSHMVQEKAISEYNEVTLNMSTWLNYMWKIDEQKQYCSLKNKRGINEMKFYFNYICFCPARVLGVFLPKTILLELHAHEHAHTHTYPQTFNHMCLCEKFIIFSNLISWLYSN